jgi:hypothetical protein
MSAEIDERLGEIAKVTIPMVKKRVLAAMERSREDVESEMARLANLFTIRDSLQEQATTH